MRHYHRSWLAAVLAMGGAALAVACSDDAGPGAPEAPAAISFSASGYFVALRGERRLQPVLLDRNGAELSATAGLTWESSQPEIASVDHRGVVSGAALGGPVTIRVRAGAVEASASVTVVPAEVRITPAVGSIAVGASVQLGLSAADALGAAIPTGLVVWSSDVPGVATVDAATGLLAATSTGSTTIRANADGFSANAALYVGVPRPFDGEFVSTDTPNLDVRLTIFLGRITQFTADHRPSSECRFEFGSTPNFELTAPNFNFQLSTWATAVSGFLVSDSVITGVIGTIPASKLSPGCLLWFGLSNRDLGSLNVIGPGFTIRRL